MTGAIDREAMTKEILRRYHGSSGMDGIATNETGLAATIRIALDVFTEQMTTPEQYAAGLDFAADVAHAEARWQTELAKRTDDMVGRARHRYVAERSTKIEGAIRGVAACARPGTAS